MARAEIRCWRVARPNGGAAWCVVGSILVLLLAGFPFSAGTARAASPGLVVPNSSAVSSTLEIGSLIGSPSANPFYAVVFTPIGLGPANGPALGAYFNSSPFTWFRLSIGADGYDPTTNTNWVAPPGGGTYQPVSQQLLNFTWFKAWCDSRTPHCNWIGTLPAEENDTSFAVHTAKWYHNVLKFAPTAWQFDNEPDAWTHYGKNLSSWSTTDNHAPTGWDYATMVKNYIRAITKVFPTDKFIGIEANCACGKSQIPTTAQVDGSKVMGMAFHEYPWLTNSATSASQFMGALTSGTGIPTFASKMRALDALNCTCSNLPIEIGEYQAGIFDNHSPLAHTYDGAPFMLASVIQAIESNVSMFTVYELGDLYNSSTGVLLPEGLAYQRILDNVTMGQAYSVNVSAPGVGGVFALLTVNGTHESLLVVNTNATLSIKFTLTPSLFPVGSLGTHYGWASTQLVPNHTYGTLPRSFTMLPLGILLLTT